MGSKRSAPPPPSPAPAASSEETASRSGSDTDESEEEIAHSPPPAAPKSSAPPPPGPESEGSDEDEGDEEEDEEEEEDEKAHHVTPPSQTQEAEGKGAKPSSSSEGKKPAGASFQPTWSTDDDVRVLEVMAAYRRQHGKLPKPEALEAALADSLDKSGCSRSELKTKVNVLKRRYTLAANKGEPPSKDHDLRLFDLSNKVWGAAAPAPASGGAQAQLGFSEMFQMYPYLAEEVKAHDKEQPGLFKRVHAMIDDDKARALDLKIKKQRMLQMKLQMRRYDLTKEVTKTLMDLVD